MVISSQEDGIYKDINRGLEIDLDEKFNIGIIKEIIYDDEDHCFYLVANKFDEKLGFFIIKMDERVSDPIKEGDYKFLTKYKNKLDIGDCKLFVMRSNVGKNGDTMLKELVISYKTIYINTYNIVIMDISKASGQSMVAKHESF